MPSIRCICDHIISLGAIPSPNKYLVIPDVTVEDFVEEIKANPSDEQIFDSLHKIAKDLAKCASCGRIWIDEKNDNVYRSYAPE
ncbi:hypothetical protein B0I18_10272 [Taibaiella chishuiensis]|uniref:Uncharacterized protein n=1 Tax=Taibaiella chishuiensis TaxID=1434707 RepID=A0A2P8D7B8_9BACT|nr:hypothetical protein B0I18_10272 [Taibaiella chishuiensis]